LSRDDGYTYITILIVVFTLALAALTTWIPSSTISAREKELELLFRGRAYVLAISSYYFSDAENPALPTAPENLINDPRFPGKRHMRSLYVDPVSNAQWDMVYGSGGGLVGVRSSSHMVPIKQSGFSEEFSEFEDSDSYSDWGFVFIPSE